MVRFLVIGLCVMVVLLVEQRAVADSVLSDEVIVNGVRTVIPEPPAGGAETPTNLVVGPADPNSFSGGIELTEPGDPSYISDEIWVAVDNQSATGLSFVFLSDDEVSLLPLANRGVFLVASIPETGLPQDLSAYFPIRGGGFNQVSVQSDIESVPLPSSAWCGLSLLGSLGLLTLIRKRAVVI